MLVSWHPKKTTNAPSSGKKIIQAIDEWWNTRVLTQCLTSRQSTSVAVTDVGFAAPQENNQPTPPAQVRRSFKPLTNGGTHGFSRNA
jgi:hypothetical protein